MTIDYDHLTPTSVAQALQDLAPQGGLRGARAWPPVVRATARAKLKAYIRGKAPTGVWPEWAEHELVAARRDAAHMRLRVIQGGAAS